MRDPGHCFLREFFTALVSCRIKFTWILFFENTLKIKNFFKKNHGK